MYHPYMHPTYSFKLYTDKTSLSKYFFFQPMMNFLQVFNHRDPIRAIYVVLISIICWIYGGKISQEASWEIPEYPFLQISQNSVFSFLINGCFDSQSQILTNKADISQGCKMSKVGRSDEHLWK